MNKCILIANVHKEIFEHFDSESKKKNIPIVDLFSEWVDTHFTNMVDGGLSEELQSWV